MNTINKKLKRRNNLRLIIMILFIGLFVNCSEDENNIYNLDNFNLISSSLTIWQLPNAEKIMNSYILITENKKIVLIDGGDEDEANFLFDLIKHKFNGHVNYWFISHPHCDHIGALIKLLNTNKFRSLLIDSIFISFPSIDDVMIYEPISVEKFVKYKLVLNKNSNKVRELNLGEIISIDSIKIEILGIKNSDITVNYLNNSSVVMKVSDKNKSVLFTGDIGIEASTKLLQNDIYKLHSDYVQMSHHGNGGASQEFYNAVNPSYCLWPTPLWLYNGENVKGKSPWANNTLIVRSWMRDLGVKQNYIMGNGFCQVY